MPCTEQHLPHWTGQSLTTSLPCGMVVKTARQTFTQYAGPRMPQKRRGKPRTGQRSTVLRQSTLVMSARLVNQCPDQRPASGGAGWTELPFSGSYFPPNPIHPISDIWRRCAMDRMNDCCVVCPAKCPRDLPIAFACKPMSKGHASQARAGYDLLSGGAGNHINRHTSRAGGCSQNGVDACHDRIIQAKAPDAARAATPTR